MIFNIDILIIFLTARPTGILPVTKWNLFLKAQEGRTQYFKAGDVAKRAFGALMVRSTLTCNATMVMGEA